MFRPPRSREILPDLRFFRCVGKRCVVAVSGRQAGSGEIEY